MRRQKKFYAWGYADEDLSPEEIKPWEAELAARYGVSRSVVREALRSCAALGLTQTHTGKGTFVVSARSTGDLVLGRYSARDLTEARPHVEVPAAGLAALGRRVEEEPEEGLRQFAAGHRPYHAAPGLHAPL